MIPISFRQKQLPCRSVSDYSQLLNCLYGKQSEKYSSKWDRGLSLSLYCSHEMLSTPSVGSMNLVKHLVKQEDTKKKKGKQIHNDIYAGLVKRESYQRH